MRIKYIDTICTNGMHLMFNATLLVMLHKICCNIIFYGEKGNIREVLRMTDKYSYNLRSIKVNKIWMPVAFNPIYARMLFFSSFFYNIWLLITSKRDDLLIFNYNNLLSVKVLNFINKIYYNRKIVVFCHGEMEFLIANYKQYGLFNKILIWFAKDFFLNPKIKIHKHIRFVVMGESVLRNIQKVTPPNVSKSFFSIDHAYFFKKNIQKNNNKSIINIGTVGVFSKIKGADDFCRLCSLAKKNNVEFSITGRIFYDIDKLQKLDINLPSNKGEQTLKRDEFEARIDQLDFITFLYPKESYKLIASGAILDAINMQKPILAISNEYFVYLFEKFGVFGYLAESVEDLADIILSMKSYNSSVFDYKAIQYKLSVESIADKLKEELFKINFIK